MIAAALLQFLRPAVLVLVVVVVAAGCKDAGVERYQKARAHYDALIQKATPLTDPAFDDVRKELEAVPADSSAHADAQKLAAGIVRAKSLPPRPLAFVPTPDAGAIDVKCATLAEALGLADGGAQRAEVLEALKKCRDAQEREHAHSNEGGEDEPH